MNTKFRWVGVITAVCLFILSRHLQSQQQESPATVVLPGETKETILKEKIEALDKTYQQMDSAYRAGVVSMVDIQQTRCELALAKAELASAVGKPKQEIEHLRDALKFAELWVECGQPMRPGPTIPGSPPIGIAPSSDLTKAIIQRADIKLALLRAKQRTCKSGKPSN